MTQCEHRELGAVMCADLEQLYTDEVGGQRTIIVTAVDSDDNDRQWLTAVNRHWYLDHPGPR